MQRTTKQTAELLAARRDAMAVRLPQVAAMFPNLAATLPQVGEIRHVALDDMPFSASIMAWRKHGVRVRTFEKTTAVGLPCHRPGETLLRKTELTERTIDAPGKRPVQPQNVPYHAPYNHHAKQSLHRMARKGILTHDKHSPSGYERVNGPVAERHGAKSRVRVKYDESKVKRGSLRADLSIPDSPVRFWRQSDALKWSQAME